MTPRLFHKRIPKPQLLDLGLPLSLPSPVTNLLDPLVQINGPSSSSGSPSQQPPKPKENPPPNPSPLPSPPPAPPAASSSSPSTGGSSGNGGNSNSGDKGNNGGNQSSGNGSSGTSGNQGNQNGNNSNKNGQGNGSNGNGSGGQSSSPNPNLPSSQNGSSTSGSSESGSDQPQSPNKPPPIEISSTTGGGSSSSSNTNSPTSSLSSNAVNDGSGGVVNFEPAPDSVAPILGGISSPVQTGGPTLKSGQAGYDNDPLDTGQPQPSKGLNSSSSSNDSFGVAGNNNGASSSLWSNNPSAITSTNSPSPTIVSVNGVTGSKSRVGDVAAGVVGSIATLALIAFILFFLRRRHQQKKADRRITWITGFVDGNAPDMMERNSIRSSWGTPAERLTWARPSNEDPVASRTTLPILPLPVHSPSGSVSPENPFSDVLAFVEGPSHQHLVPSTLPIRLSLISAGSGQNPFDDVNQTTDPINNLNGGQVALQQNANTTGHGPSQANFPLPPSTPASVKSGIAIGSPSDLGQYKNLLAAPSLSLDFPDSPISPTFASPNAASFSRRVSVKYNFVASQARSDEVHLEKGEEVSLVSVYEDGWAFVQKKDKERGLVPLNCLNLTE